VALQSRAIAGHPAMLGPYQIEAVLGRGGMGVVYRARDPEHDRPVAIKTVMGATPNLQAALRAEIVALKRVCHPSVVRVLAEGLFNGAPWYAMELVEGPTLAEFNAKLWKARRPERDIEFGTTATRRTSLDVPADAPAFADSQRAPVAAGRLEPVLAIYRQLCLGLSYIHRLGLVHRDVKPSNVCLRQDNVPVLMDFGLATRTQGGIGRETLVPPVGGKMLGTIPYVSPEQIRGDVGDARSDLYSLGCMLYESLVGGPPFRDAEARTILQSHLSATPRPLSQVVDGVPMELERLVLRLLAKVPHERLGDAEDVAAALARLGTAPAPEPSSRAREFKPYLFRPRLVGRTAALEAIESAQRRLELGSGGLLLIAGESGIGKTSIVTETAQRLARRDCEIVTAECEPVGDLEDRSDRGRTPFQPFRSLLQRALDYALDPGGRDELQLLPEDAQLLSSYEPSLACLGAGLELLEPTPFAPGAARKRVFQALQRVLGAFALVRPLVWILDDLQWSDELSLSFLTSLPRDFLSQCRVLIIATYRNEEIADPLRRLLDAGSGEIVNLARLGPAAIEAMVQDMLALQAAPPLLVDFLVRSSRGNPFFVAEFLRVAVREGLLKRRVGEWELSPELKAGRRSPLENMPLPEALKDLMSRHIHQLESGCRDVLSAASVLGVEVEIDLLSRVFGGSVLEPLATLTQEHLLEASAPGYVRFAHSQLKDFAYSMVGEESRMHLHGRAAQAFEGEPGSTAHPAARYPTLAHHWAAARQPLKAAQYFLLAAQHAHANHANEEAIRFYQSTIELLTSAAGSAGTLLICSAHEQLADVLRTTGMATGAEQNYLSALALGPTDDPLVSARLFRKLGKTRIARQQYEQALEAFGRAADVLRFEVEGAASEHSGRFAEWVELQLGRAWAYYWTNDSRELDKLLPALGQLIKSRGTVVQLAQYHEAVCFAELRRDRYAVSRDSLSIIRKAARWVSAPTISRERASIHFALGFALVLCGSHADACDELKAVVQFAERVGDVLLRVRALTYLSVAYRRLGRVERVRALATQTLALALEYRLDHYLGAGKANLGWVQHNVGQPADAERLLLEALEHWKCARIAFPFQGLAIWPLGELLATQGRLREAIAQLRWLDADPQQALPPDIQSLLARCQDDSAQELRELFAAARAHHLL